MHEEMKKPELSEVCQIEKDLISALKTVTSHGVFSKDVDSKELGELVDMVKDMAETKRNCWEAHYYETVSKAMEEYDYDSDDRMGYNRNRYASGRYAPSGTGNRTMGYMMPIYPSSKRDPYFFNPIEEPIMGYDKDMDGRSRNDSSNSSGRSNWRNDQNNSYGYPYGHDMRDFQYGKSLREYEDARRHYTESKSLEDKSHMDKKAMEHVNHSMMTLREIWKNADPTVKKEVSSSIASLAAEFKTA